MLLSEHAIVVFERGRAIPDRLTRQAHARYPAYAGQMLRAYRQGIGRTRRALHQAVERILADEPDCDPRRVQAFAKLLDDLGEFDTDRAGRAARLRLQVFGLAAAYHPLVAARGNMFEHEEAEVKTKIASELGRSWDEIESALYADVIDEQRLRTFGTDYDETALLARYNVAQTQACLYRAAKMTIEAAADFKPIIRAAKLAGLLHEITRLGPSRYRIFLSGPASVLRRTRSYGVNMAKILPVLLACADWKMTAEIEAPFGRPALLGLSPADGLSSRASSPPEYDSELERKFAANFGAKRDGWTLIREGGIIHAGQRVFIPDFVFRHEDGTEVLFEIVGFWTPQYLAHRLDTLKFCRGQPLLLAAPINIAAELPALPECIITFAHAIKVPPLLERLERIRGKR
jgi:uncharacterized protein